MKLAFEIKTEPALHVAFVIAIVVTSSSALATIAVVRISIHGYL
jgi:hypothetical protein